MALTGLERVIKALQLQEPDTVPTFEPPHAKIREQILPGSSSFDLADHLDLDAVQVDDRGVPSWKLENLDAEGKYFRNQWGTVCRVTAETLPHPVEGAVKSEKDLDTWQPPTLMTHGDMRCWPRP